MTKRKQTKHWDDVLRGIRDPERYDPKARSVGGPWRMVKCKDGAYVCYELYLEVMENLRKFAEINPAQSPHDGIHTCSKGCKKPGCNRGLRETIEEQDAQIEALKQDLLEQTASVRNSRMANIHDLNHIGGLQEENARLKADVRNCYTAIRVKDAEIDRLKAELNQLNERVQDPYRLSKGWQPIETAPMDGTEFIGYSQRCSMNVVHYGMSDDGEGWLIWAGFCTQLIEVPTHWMPLPKPPTK